MNSFANYVKDLMGVLPTVNQSSMLSGSMTGDNAQYREDPFYKSRAIQARNQATLDEELLKKEAEDAQKAMDEGMLRGGGEWGGENNGTPNGTPGIDMGVDGGLGGPGGNLGNGFTGGLSPAMMGMLGGALFGMPTLGYALGKGWNTTPAPTAPTTNTPLSVAQQAQANADMGAEAAAVAAQIGAGGAGIDGGGMGYTVGPGYGSQGGGQGGPAADTGFGGVW
tara:strand:+ start:6051 stop:6719 length:669 start_codon:yes stop_codon:yes gene_type:complete